MTKFFLFSRVTILMLSVCAFISTTYTLANSQTAGNDHSTLGETHTRKETSDYSDLDVELFVTDWCPYCKKAIAFFASKGITPKIFNIEKDPQARKRKNQLDPKPGVPFAIIDGTPVHGFSDSYYQLILNQEL